MKVVRSIGLFFVTAILFGILGFYLGNLTRRQENNSKVPNRIPNEWANYGEWNKKPEDDGEQEAVQSIQNGENLAAGFLDVASLAGVIGSETEWIVQEADVLRGGVLETRRKMPSEYVGLDRQGFMEVMERYQAVPPLSERERGFVGLEVLSFSRKQIIVRMDYRYVQPGEAFYLGLKDHKVVVFLEDKKTIYIETDITDRSLDSDTLQHLVDLIYVKDESSLYDFLEAYSS